MIHSSQKCVSALATFLLLTTLAPAGEAQSTSLGRPGDGNPVCGLGKEFHAGRRAELMKRFPGELLLFRGMPETRDYTPFRQDKTFWYLTGIESSNAAILLDAKSGRQVLFLPGQNTFKERWEGELWDDEDAWVRELTGFEDVRSSGELMATIEDFLGDRKKIGVSLHPHITLASGYDRARPHDKHRRQDPLDGRANREEALAEKLAEHFEVEVFDVADEIIDMRLVKTPEEIEAMKRAGRAGALAMVEAMRSSRPGIGEWDLDSLMSFVQIREGADGMAYHAIVGSGANSCVLHYSANSRRMGPGEVVLIDYGPEVDHYTTDITRTWPVDGVFTERMAELYDAVLAAQEAGIAAVKPGATIGEISAVCNEVLKERGFSDLTLHGACHYIGQEVHDPGDYQKPFEPGVAFTVEPGLYDTKAGIGIRIEDVVVVTEEGCEVITSLVPKDREALSALVAEEGVLDWLAEDRSE